MNKLPYVVFLIVFFIPFFTRGLNILPGPTVLLFELMSGLIFVIALFYFAYHKSFSVSPKYLILFLVVCLHFTVGAVANSMDPATVFAGIRSYLKYMPLFFLPLVYAYSDKEFTGQLKFLTTLALLQVPLVIIEFFILGWGPDIVGGTFWLGSYMSIFMVSTIVVLIAFYFRERIDGKSFLMLALLIFIPTTLNESKGTVILLTLGILVIMLAGNLKRSQIIMATSILVIMISSFTVIYNMYFTSYASTAGGFWSFFTTNPAGIENYLYSGDSKEIDPDTILEPPSSLPGALSSLEEEKYRSRRIDSIILPLRALSNDPVKLLLGLGIGNTSKSASMRFFAGQYSFLEEGDVLGSALSGFIWEIGILGVFLYILFFGFIYRDAKYLAKTEGLPGAFALGWTGVVVVILISLPYKNIFLSETLSVLVWYLSGYIAAKSYVMKKAGHV